MKRTTTIQKYSPDDLLQMPDEGLGFELIDGELRERNVSKQSSLVAGEVHFHLRLFGQAKSIGWFFPEGNSYRCFPDDPDRVRRADVSFIARSRMTPEEYVEEGHTEIAPDLAVEVTSPNDTVYDVDRKIREWLAAGVRLVWEINPEEKTVQIYRPDGTVTFLKSSDTLTAEPVLPGFSVPVADLFKLPAQTKTA
ncbi:MAG TPA: Uma2 family endonuclease [Fimbriiglobus sp.]|jgi:Uma2 family endonuclease